MLQLFTLFVFVFEYFTLFEYIRIVSVFTNSIRIRFKLPNEYYSVFVFVPKSLFVPTLKSAHRPDSSGLIANGAAGPAISRRYFLVFSMKTWSI